MVKVERLYQIANLAYGVNVGTGRGVQEIIGWDVENRGRFCGEDGTVQWDHVTKEEGSSVQ